MSDVFAMERVFVRKRDRDAEVVKNAKIKEAEKDLALLRERGLGAIATLEARRRRNHWRESIEEILRGMA